MEEAMENELFHISMMWQAEKWFSLGFFKHLL